MFEKVDFLRRSTSVRGKKNKEKLRYTSTDRVVISYHYFRRSAQYLRSSIGLTRRICSKDFRSFFFQCGGDLYRSWMTSRTPESYQLFVILQRIHFQSIFQCRDTCSVVTTKDPEIFKKTFEWVKLATTVTLWERFLVSNILWHFTIFTSSREDEERLSKLKG